ncbi:hypothetical protein G7046_g6320 [Stylonectria norvegica]|nr:hypothetical protein G7046_g6320 [Stylonectria norvegica]
MKTILVVGATGAQSGAVVRVLSATGQYKILALTRSASSSQAVALGELPNVELVISDIASGYNIDTFSAAASRSDYVLVNTDGFSLGEQAETFWGIRLFELSARAGVKHLIYSGLDSIGKLSGYEPDLYVGHYEGKARVQEWMQAQKNSKMAWTIIRSGPYIESLSSLMAPAVSDDGTMTFQLPLADGAIPFIHLGDFGNYVRWALEHPEQSNRLDFGVATSHVSGNEIAEASQRVTGKPATYAAIPIEAWNSVAWGNLPRGPQTKIGFQTVKDDNALTMSYGDNFAHWWNLYKASNTDNTGLIQRDYGFLDKILPERVRSVEEWMRKVGYTSERRQLLKLQSHTD